MYDITNPKWCFGTCGQRVAAVLELADGHYENSQQLLYEIAFCDPVKDVRLAAVYCLNRMWHFEPIMCYQGIAGEEFFPEYLSTHIQYRFHSDSYGGDFPDRRLSVIPYIERQELLKAIIMCDSEDAVVVKAAAMLESPKDLELAYRSAPCSTAGRHGIGAYMRERQEGRPAKKPIRLAEPDTTDYIVPPKRAPSFGELRTIAWRICHLPYGEQATVTEQEAEIAITALVELYDMREELVNALWELYAHPDFKHKNILKKYDGIRISAALECGLYGFREDAGRFYLPREESK